MKEKLYDLRAIPVEMRFKIANGVITLLPDVPIVQQLIGDGLALKNFRVHTHDQHFFVIRTVENTDHSAFRET